MLKPFLSLLYFVMTGILIAQTTPTEMISRMGRGINLGNVLSAPNEGNWSGAATEQYFIDVAQAGFKNVRIPIDFFGDRTSGDTSNYSSNPDTSYSGLRSDYQINSDYLDRVEQVIGWGLNQGLVIILDVHGAELKSEFIYTFDPLKTAYTDPTSAKRAADLDKFYAIWTQIADRFKMFSDDLIFEIINEPYFHISSDEMNDINTSVISIIRDSAYENLTRKIIITGGTKASYESPTTISTSILNSDNFLITTFHYYRPFSFTKSSDYRYNTNTWGTTSDTSTLDAEFDTVLNWAQSFSPPLAVYLGEFAADNAYGYAYQTGDLKYVAANQAPNGTGYADGGPDPVSRAKYFNYVAEAAISRGFSFSAWDAGGESSKTIHFRKDSGITVYDMDYFSVQSYNPKQTTPSTVVDTNLWVEDVKDALLSQGCYSSGLSEIVVNPDFECGVDFSWSLSQLGDAVANLSNAENDSYSGHNAAKIQVTSADTHNKVLFKNSNIYSGDLQGKSISVRCYAKANIPGIDFKMRFKINGGGFGNFYPSESKILTEVYQPYEFVFSVPEGTDSVQFEAMFGNNIGTYFLDDIQLDVSSTFSISDTIDPKVTLYPVPVKDRLTIKTDRLIENIELFDFKGRLMKFKKDHDAFIDLAHIPFGFYILKITDRSNVVTFDKILIH